jgi:hypothetical protein
MTLICSHCDTSLVSYDIAPCCHVVDVMLQLCRLELVCICCDRCAIEVSHSEPAMLLAVDVMASHNYARGYGPAAAIPLRRHDCAWMRCRICDKSIMLINDFALL